MNSSVKYPVRKVSFEILIIILLVPFVSHSQVTTSFTVQDSVCIGEELHISNSTINAENYIWDFCQNGLDSVKVNLNQFLTPPEFRME